jgi:hypothetical protein
MTLVAVTKHTLYGWQKRFKADGPAGLTDRPRGAGQHHRTNKPQSWRAAPLDESAPEPRRRSPSSLPSKILNVSEMQSKAIARHQGAGFDTVRLMTPDCCDDSGLPNSACTNHEPTEEES